MNKMSIGLKAYLFLKYFSIKVYNHFFWQSRNERAKKKYPKPFVYESEYGFKTILDLHKDVDRFFYLNGFESDYISYYYKMVKKGAIVFDIGANIGLFSLIAATKMSNEGAIYAFEPAEMPHKQFENSIKLNDYTIINLEKLGVADQVGKISFNVCEDDAYNSLGNKPMKEIKEIIEINVTSVDTFCAEKNIEKIDILKMDTEGAEYLILEGGKRIFSAEDAPIIFSEYNRMTIGGFDYSLNNFEKILCEYGYELYEIEFGILKKFHSSNSKSNEIICFKERHKQMLNIR